MKRAMKFTQLLFCCFLLTLPISVRAESGNGVNASDSVKAFVQRFYDWYVPKALNSRSESAWSTAVKTTGRCFSRKRSFCAGRSGLTAAFIQAARALTGRAAFQAQGMSSSIRLFGWPLTIRVRTSVR